MKTIIEEREPPLVRAKDRGFPKQLPEHAAADLQVRTILVPLDFSRMSMQALKYAIPLAEEFHAAIHLVHVQPADDLTGISRAGDLMLTCADAIAFMQDRLAEVQEKHDVKFWPDNCHVVSGRAYEEICKLARKLRIDLIVIPTHGHGGLKRIALGSTAERVIRHAPCPVLIPRKGGSALLGPEGKFALRKILVPLDFSECSLAGLDYAARLARQFGSGLRLLHVIFPYTQMFALDRFAGDLTPLVQNARIHAEEEMKKVGQLGVLGGIPCETQIRTGPAIEEICAESAKSDIDLMVTATHGRTGFKHAIIGSVAEHVVRYAESPVLIVPNRSNFV